MAGSYHHATTKSGKLRSNETFVEMVENLGDAYETVEELYGMIWYLAWYMRGEDADSRAEIVERARQNFREGIEYYSPGIED